MKEEDLEKTFLDVVQNEPKFSDSVNGQTLVSYLFEKFVSNFSNCHFIEKTVKKEAAKPEPTEEQIQHLMNLGFERDMCRSALIMAKLQLEQAIEILLTNMPQLNTFMEQEARR